MYYWRIHDNSLSHKNDTCIEKLKSQLELYYNVLENFHSSKKTKAYLLANFFKCILNLQMKYNEFEDLNLKLKVKQYGDSYLKDFLCNPFINFKLRILYLLCYKFSTS